MSTKHTPGPFLIHANHLGEPQCVYSDSTKRQLLALWPFDECSKEERLANFRLFSAAPEMLAATKSALELILWLGGEFPEHSSKFDGHWASYQNQIQEAIAKAEGGSHV